MLWGTFAVVGDPSRSGKAPVRVPGAVRLAIQLRVFIGGAVAGDVVEPADLPERISGKAPVAVPVVPTAGPRPFRPLLEEIAELERTRKKDALAAAKAVQKHAAELIGMPRPTFVYKMREHQLGSDVGKE